MEYIDSRKIGRGRPKKHTDKELMDLLLFHASSFPDRINSTAIAKETGISRSTWDRRMGRQINELNTRPITVHKNNDCFPIANPADFVDLYKNNPEKLKTELTSFYYIVMNLLDKAKSHEALAKENEELRLENTIIKSELLHLQEVAATLSKNIHFTEVIKGNFISEKKKGSQKQLDIDRHATSSIFIQLEQQGLSNVVAKLNKKKK